MSFLKKYLVFIMMFITTIILIIAAFTNKLTPFDGMMTLIILILYFRLKQKTKIKNN